MDLPGELKAAGEQSGADDCDEGESELGDHQKAAELFRVLSGGTAATALLESVTQVGAGRVQGRRDSR
jgi:hypothetical protein